MTVTDTGTTAGRAGATAGGALRITGVRKSYGGSRGVQDVSLDVAPGEFLTMLGPSGSGKTTTLNLVAGFLDPDAGSVELDGEELAGVPPHRRGPAVRRYRPRNRGIMGQLSPDILIGRHHQLRRLAE